MSDKVAYVPWWKPIMLVKRNGEMLGMTHIGWLWRQKAYQRWNINHGWIAFIEDQTEENLNKVICKCCGKEK